MGTRRALGGMEVCVVAQNTPTPFGGGGRDMAFVRVGVVSVLCCRVLSRSYAMAPWAQGRESMPHCNRWDCLMCGI